MVKKRPADALERAWLDLVHKVPCVLCGHLGMPPSGSTEAHHVYEGVGLSQRASHFRVAALCRTHHQNKVLGVASGTRAFYSRYRLDELDCVDMTVRAVFALLQSERESHPSVETQLRTVLREYASTRKALYDAQRDGNIHRLRADAAELLTAEWKRRFYALLKRDHEQHK